MDDLTWDNAFAWGQYALRHAIQDFKKGTMTMTFKHANEPTTYIYDEEGEIQRATILETAKGHLYAVVDGRYLIQGAFVTITDTQVESILAAEKRAAAVTFDRPSAF